MFANQAGNISLTAGRQYQQGFYASLEFMAVLETALNFKAL